MDQRRLPRHVPNYSLCDIVGTDVVRVKSSEDGADGKEVVVLVESRHFLRSLFWERCVCELGDVVNSLQQAICICASVVQTPNDFSSTIEPIKRANFLRLSCRNRRDEVLRHSCESFAWSLEPLPAVVLDLMARRPDSIACNMTTSTAALIGP